jgi:hypothetical protein
MVDRDEIDGLLGRYRAAFNGLDASVAKSVWPGLDAPALQRAFEQLESQDLTFSECSVRITGLQAVANCSGNLTYVPKVGGRSPRTEYRLWDFSLRRSFGRWRITGVDTR